MRRIGHSGDLASKIRDSLLGIGRIVPFVATHATDWLPLEIKPRLETVRLDVTSLSDYDMHIVNKVQLLLDATLGLINIEQNNIIKVLTIVSVVGIPPTLIASMYGMNFKDMPELDWSWGYPYGLALIVLSAILPIALVQMARLDLNLLLRPQQKRPRNPGGVSLSRRYGEGKLLRQPACAPPPAGSRWRSRSCAAWLPRGPRGRGRHAACRYRG